VSNIKLHAQFRFWDSCLGKRFCWCLYGWWCLVATKD